VWWLVVLLLAAHLHHHADRLLLGREGVLGQGISGVQHERVDALVRQAAATTQRVLPPAAAHSTHSVPLALKYV
jgi:hypothetical protein